MKLSINRQIVYLLFWGIIIIFSSCYSTAAKRQRPLVKDDPAGVAVRKAYDRGKEMWFNPDLGTNGRNCESCHPKGLMTNAETYPRYKHVLRTMATLSMTHNFAIVNESKGMALELGSEDANALVLFVNSLANGKRVRMAPPNELKKEWVQKGKEIFFSSTFGARNQSCQSCHNEGRKQASNAENEVIPSLKGVAAAFPKYHDQQNRVITLEQQINHCIEKYLTANPLPLNHETMVALCCYLTAMSEGSKISVAKFD